MQKNFGELGWSAGQAAVALCVWSVTTFWGLVFTPVALAIVGMMYWDEIEERLRSWRASLDRILRWQRKRAQSHKDERRQNQHHGKGAASKSSKGKRNNHSSHAGSSNGALP